MGKIKEFLSRHKRLRRLLVMLVLLAVFFVGFCFGYTAQIVGTQESGHVAIRASAEEVTIPVSSTHKITEWDTIDYEALKLIIQSAEYTFTGKEPFGVWSSEKMYAYSVGVLLHNEGSLDMTQIKSNFFDYPVLSMTGTTAVGCTSVYFRFPVETYPEFSTIEKFKSWLSEKSAEGNPLKVTYKTEAAYSVGLDYFYNAGKTDGHEEGYQEGEKVGHEAGKQEGYDEGYKDASDTLNLGVLYGATASGNFTYTNGQKLTLTNGKPDFSYNGLNFNSIWGKYYNYNGDTENMLETAEMTLNFKTSFQYDGFPLYFLGDSDVMSATFISTANKRYNANIEKYNETAIGADYALIRIRENEKEEGIEVKALTIRFGRASDTLYNANVLSLSGGFLNGYDNGYNDGFSHGQTDGVISGRKEGYEQGKQEGYGEGYNEGVTQQMTSSVGNFFKSIYSVFDVNIFGPIKLGHFIFIPLVLSLLLIVLKLFRG